MTNIDYLIDNFLVEKFIPRKDDIKEQLKDYKQNKFCYLEVTFYDKNNINNIKEVVKVDHNIKNLFNFSSLKNCSKVEFKNINN